MVYDLKALPDKSAHVHVLSTGKRGVLVLGRLSPLMFASTDQLLTVATVTTFSRSRVQFFNFEKHQNVAANCGTFL